MKTIIRIGNRPTEAPEGWPIHNAPRPLYGQKVWQGDFVHGVFYAAVDPADEYSPGFIKGNEQNDAYELVYMSKEQAMNEALEYYRSTFPSVYPKIDTSDEDHQRMVIEGWIRNRNQ